MRLDMFDYCTDELKERLAPVRKAMADRQLKATKAAADSSAMEVESQSGTATECSQTTAPHMMALTYW
mgnify:CR=1 FL=1